MTKLKSNFLQQKPLIIIIIYTMRWQYCSVREGATRNGDGGDSWARRSGDGAVLRVDILGTRTSTPSAPQKLLTFHGSTVRANPRRGDGSRRDRDGLPRRKSRSVSGPHHRGPLFLLIFRRSAPPRVTTDSASANLAVFARSMFLVTVVTTVLSSNLLTVIVAH